MADTHTPRPNTPRPVDELLSASTALSVKQREVLEALRQFPKGALVDDLSARLGMHTNTVRGHLDDLIAADAVFSARVPGQGRGRPRHVYYARVPHHRSVTGEYVTLINVLADQLPEGDVAAAHAIGRTWAKRSQVVGECRPAGDAGADLAEVHAALREMGFAPQMREEEGEIGLTACPFITEGGQRPNPLICAMHVGYLQQLTGSDNVTLMPFDRPGECGARIE